MKPFNTQNLKVVARRAACIAILEDALSRAMLSSNSGAFALRDAITRLRRCATLHRMQHIVHDTIDTVESYAEYKDTRRAVRILAAALHEACCR